MTPSLTVVQLAGSPELPLLVVGPSLGTSAESLWARCAALLGETFHVVGWELPGHGRGTPATAPFTMADLAAGVLAAIEPVLVERGEAGGTFGYAGDSVGGAAGLQLLLDAGDRVTAAAMLCTGAKIGETDGWLERAALVRRSGTPVMVAGSSQRWFAPGFLEREQEAGVALLGALQHADAESYALVCEALAAFDVRDRLEQIGAPVLAVAGIHDEATPPDSLREIATGVAVGTFVELDGVAHLAAAEAPHTVASLLTAHLGTHLTGGAGDPYDAGMVVRREVLGDAHVDRAIAHTTDVNAAYQELITRYAWGSIWTRPGLDRRSRSVGVLTALIAGRHFDELEFHLVAALRNGLTKEEIVEVLLQTAIYAGVPCANSAFAVANRVLNES
ncbi:MAG: alpha/beta fold hydrolase [Nocardioides sp.]|uniref:bifunctional 3-oxoadipate enol-lactonase/4-carboxymuconolactone decarboxylase PcaDC n=1 Tax=Nocardioides sp. TaxID=35761 RepID=UPI0039E28FA1